MDSAPEVTRLEPGPAISIRAQLSIAELPQFFGSAFGELASCGADQIAGAPFAIYHSFDPAGIDVEAVMPLRAVVPVHGRVHELDLQGGPAVQIRHVGSYDELGTAYGLLERWLDDHHRVRSAAVREVYLTPPSLPPAQQVTLVIQPLKAPDRASA